MIQDLEQLPRTGAVECDLCIVGCGAAGLALAAELGGTGLRIVVLESGAAAQEAATQRLYESRITGQPFPGAMDGRFRRYGGSTTVWGGQSLPLTEVDFEPRDWVAHSGWPLRRGELESFYRRAAAFLLTDALNFDTDLFSMLGTDPPRFDPALVRYHFSKWSRRPDLRTTYGPAIAASETVRLVLHANLTRLVLSDGMDRVRELHARSLGGASVVVRARQTVLATGGIETARILLANNEQQRGGVGNGNDLVGRYFQDHPAGQVGLVRSEREDDLQRAFNMFRRKGLRYTPRLSVAPEAQRMHAMLNVSALCEFDAGLDSPYRVMQSAIAGARYRGGRARAVGAVARGLAHIPSIARPAWEYFVRGRGWAPDPVVRLWMLTEQEPDPESRITLSDETDALEMPKSVVHWRITDATLRTMRAYARIVRDEFARLDLGTVELNGWVLDEGADWRAHLQDSKHHMGTTRMAESPETGVVDRDCRVFGIENLWIASSSVFPTGGHSNPTLTILALTMRLADRLRQELA